MASTAFRFIIIILSAPIILSNPVMDHEEKLKYSLIELFGYKESDIYVLGVINSNGCQKCLLVLQSTLENLLHLTNVSTAILVTAQREKEFKHFRKINQKKIKFIYENNNWLLRLHLPPFSMVYFWDNEGRMLRQIDLTTPTSEYEIFQYINKKLLPQLKQRI